MKSKCLNYFKCDGSKRSIEHRIYSGEIAIAIVTSKTTQPWYCFVEKDEETKD